MVMEIWQLVLSLNSYAFRAATFVCHQLTTNSASLFDKALFQCSAKGIAFFEEGDRHTYSKEHSRERVVLLLSVARRW